MADAELDLGAYFRRIGYTGDAAPTLATLRALHERHAESIPFENLSAFIGEDIPLDVASLQRKLVHGGRGGWCFEQNVFLAHVLRAMGFDVATLAARVRWSAPPGALRPRSHMLLRVRLREGDFIADVGFGGMTLTAPLRLEPGDAQETPHERFRLREEPGIFVVEAEVAGEWQPLYSFDLFESNLADYEVSNWYLAHHPQSHFVTGIVAARTEPGMRHALRGGRYTLHRRGAPSESRMLESVEDFKRILAGPFRIRVPEAPELDRKLEALLAGAKA
jgi:N-hydroxyarylamine O-acetyltransferase